jgi:tetratricopeptide (TPR) repeat protein
MALALLAFIADARAQLAKAPVPKAIAAEKVAERSALNASIFYQVMLAEMSFNNGDIGAAYSLMLNAARESNEAQLFQRAVDIGLAGRDANAAVGAAKAWQQALPQSPEADRYLLQLLIGLNRLPETLAPLQRSVARAPQAERAGLISALTRLYVRATDKAAAADILEKALAAELGNRSSGPASWAPPKTPARMPTRLMPTCTVGRKRCGSSASASAAAAPRLPRRSIAISRPRRAETMASSLIAKMPFSTTSTRITPISSQISMPVPNPARVLRPADPPR